MNRPCRFGFGSWSAVVLSSHFALGCGQAPVADTRSDLDTWIGQMLMVGFRGLELPSGDPFLAQIRDLHLGGVVLFDFDVPTRTDGRNIRDFEQVRRLTSRLRLAASLPLLIAIDQEGGGVARLKPKYGFPESRSQASLGAADDEAATRAQGRSTALLLKELGFNLNFSPVVDLNLNSDNPVIGRLERSFSASPAVVVKHASWIIEEHRRVGILTAVKHFPGHGSSEVDSHLGLPDVTRHWDRRELIPFASLIQEGKVDMVMTGHLFNSDWDDGYSATLSAKVIGGMLRKGLGFQGVIVSDDLQMGAIVQNHGFEETIELAVRAGCDLLVFANNSSFDAGVAPKAVEVIRRLVVSGRVPPERIRESFDRIQKLKAGL